MNTTIAPFSQERLREIAWNLGGYYPLPLTTNGIALYMVHPHSGHVDWNVRPDALATLQAAYPHLTHAPLLVRVYDVTDIFFDGLNAHHFFDLHVHDLSGHASFRPPQPARHYMAEIGVRGGDGSYHALARSNSVFFERDRPSGKYDPAGLFVGGTLQRTFPVENIFDAPIYERMNQELAGIGREEPLSAAVVFAGMTPSALHSPLADFIRHFSRKLETFGGTARIFSPLIAETDADLHAQRFWDRITTISARTADQLIAAHRQSPFHVIHCHDWYSAKIGMIAADALDLPLILSFHSTEYERTQGYTVHGLSAAICAWEKDGLHAARLIIVPHSGTRHQVITLYGAPAERVVIIPDVFTPDASQTGSHGQDVRNWLGCGASDPLVLFAGEISHAAGADLLIDALPQVNGRYPNAHFVLAGNGPLKAELEARAGRSGLSHCCRFVGDVSKETFEALLLSAECVVIPARTWQGEGVAQLAIESGKPVLATHQSGIRCIIHGQNGLLTYDNPGSIVWGLQELLGHPLQGNMLRVTAKKKTKDAVSIENVAVQHYMYYEIVCHHAV